MGDVVFIYGNIIPLLECESTTIKNSSQSKYANYFKVVVENEYLFNWNDVPRNNTELTKFLKDGLKIEWVENATINKSDNNETINVTKENNSLIFKLNKTEKKVTLEINSDNTYKYILKEENGKLNIYENDIYTFSYTEEWKKEYTKELKRTLPDNLAGSIVNVVYKTPARAKLYEDGIIIITLTFSEDTINDIKNNIENNLIDHISKDTYKEFQKDKENIIKKLKEQMTIAELNEAVFNTTSFNFERLYTWFKSRLHTKHIFNDRVFYTSYSQIVKEKVDKDNIRDDVKKIYMKSVVDATRKTFRTNIQTTIDYSREKTKKWSSSFFFLSPFPFMSSLFHTRIIKSVSNAENTRGAIVYLDSQLKLHSHPYNNSLISVSQDGITVLRRIENTIKVGWQLWALLFVVLVNFTIVLIGVVNRIDSILLTGISISYSTFTIVWIISALFIAYLCANYLIATKQIKEITSFPHER